MKYSRAQVHSKARKIPDLKFEQQSLTSFSGLIVFQQLFTAIRFRDQLRRCFQHLKSGKVYGLTTVFVQLVIHIMLGYREIRDAAYYAEDPLVKRVLGLSRVPDPATISRTLKDADEVSVQSLRGLLRDMIFERLKKLLLSRITLDFDGSVQSTGRFAEGTAVGFNKKKKGQRSYYPLFCTISQTGQALARKELSDARAIIFFPFDWSLSVDRFPNLTAFDIAAVQLTLERLIAHAGASGRIGLAFLWPR